MVLDDSVLNLAMIYIYVYKCQHAGSDMDASIYNIRKLLQEEQNDTKYKQCIPLFHDKISVIMPVYLMASYQMHWHF